MNLKIGSSDDVTQDNAEFWEFENSHIGMMCAVGERDQLLYTYINEK